jgi:hypothetical protein
VKPAGISEINAVISERLINFIAKHSKNKNIRGLYRGINEFNRDYQPRSNLVRNENGDMLADPHNILIGWKNYFSQLLNVHRVIDFRQIEIHTPEPGSFEVKIAIAKFKKEKSPGSNQIPTEPIQAERETLWSEIHKLINSIWSKEEHITANYVQEEP